MLAEASLSTSQVQPKYGMALTVTGPEARGPACLSGRIWALGPSLAPPRYGPRGSEHDAPASMDSRSHGPWSELLIQNGFYRDYIGSS